MSEHSPNTEPLLRTLAPALRGLEQRLVAWMSGKRRLPLTTLQDANLRGLAADLDRNAEALQQEEPSLVIILMGGTGVGKSTLLNALAGGAVASASMARPTTRDPVVYHHQSIPSAKFDPVLRQCKLAAHDRPHLMRKIVIDTPDLDSNDLANRETLLRVLPIADVVLYVGSQEKYHDKLGWDVFLQQRRRRAFAFILNKWDRCQAPTAGGVRPDEDLIRDLKAEGFDNPLVFRTCAQHWVDNPWDPSAPAPNPPVAGEQFADLARWLETGLNRLEIEAIKARGVGQLLGQLSAAVQSATAPDLVATAQKVRDAWSRVLREEASQSSEVLLALLDPYQREIEHSFALRRQGQFRGIMSFYLSVFNKFRYSGSSLREHLPSLTPKLDKKAEPKPFDLEQFTDACSKAASEQHLESRWKALTNRLLLEGESNGMNMAVLSEPTEALANLDWKERFGQAMLEAVTGVQEHWTNPKGARRWLHRLIVWAADWLPQLALGVMATVLLWQYVVDRREFNPWDLFLPIAVVIFLILLLHVVIALFLPLRWIAIRSEMQERLCEQLTTELEKEYGRTPNDVAQELLAERRQAESFRKEIDEVADWLRLREQAASVENLYGKTDR